jgi:hypothetical protein
MAILAQRMRANAALFNIAGGALNTIPHGELGGAISREKAAAPTYDLQDRAYQEPGGLGAVGRLRLARFVIPQDRAVRAYLIPRVEPEGEE